MDNFSWIWTSVSVWIFILTAAAFFSLISFLFFPFVPEGTNICGLQSVSLKEGGLTLTTEFISAKQHSGCSAAVSWCSRIHESGSTHSNIHIFHIQMWKGHKSSSELFLQQLFHWVMSSTDWTLTTPSGHFLLAQKSAFGPYLILQLLQWARLAHKP